MNQSHANGTVLEASAETSTAVHDYGGAVTPVPPIASLCNTSCTTTVALQRDTVIERCSGASDSMKPIGFNEESNT